MSNVADEIQTALAEDLPSGWSLASIEDLVGGDGVFVDGDWVESKDQDPTGDVRLIQLADIGDGVYRNKSDRFLTHEKALELGCTFLRRDDVLIARMPDPLGRACIFPGDPKKSVTVVDVAIVRSGSGEFNHRWLMHFINAPVFRTSMASLQSGSTRKRISRGNLARIALPVPPREQQNRIVAEIEKQFSRLDEAVANLKRVKANLKRYKASVLKAAVEGKLTEDWRKLHPNVEPSSKLLERTLAERRAKWIGKGKYKEPAKSDTSNLPSLPEGWSWCAVDQISRKITDGEHLSPICQPAGIPLLSAKDVRESGILFDEVKYVSPEDAKRFRMRCDPDRNDILIVSRGATIGRSCAVKTEQMFCLMGSVILIKACGEIAASYILTALKSVSAVKRLVGASGSTAQQAIYIQDIRSLPIPLPPHDEQKQIVDEVERRLSIIEELEAAVEANLTRADRLRRAILQRVFTGRMVSSAGVR